MKILNPNNIVSVSTQNNRNSHMLPVRVYVSILKNSLTLPIKAEACVPYNLTRNSTPRCNSGRTFAQAPDDTHTCAHLTVSTTEREAVQTSTQRRVCNLCLFRYEKLCSSENDNTAIAIIWVNHILSTNRMKTNGFATLQTYYRKERKT